LISRVKIDPITIRPNMTLLKNLRRNIKYMSPYRLHMMAQSIGNYYFNLFCIGVSLMTSMLSLIAYDGFG